MNIRDIAILRDLARQVREAASAPRMDELRRKWTMHNDFKSLEPMVLFEIEGVAQEIVPEASLKCEDPTARQAEKNLRLKLFQAYEVKDDRVIDPEFRVNYSVRQHGWYERTRRRSASMEDGAQAGYVPIPVLNTPREIFELQHTEFSVDRAAMAQEMSFWENIFGDILHVRARGNYWWTMGMTWDFLRLTGMETFFTLPYDDEDAFNEIMRFLHDEAVLLIEFLEREELFTLNNANDYIGSGSYGYTENLPQPDYTGKVRAKDLWCLLESQESVSMSPAMFRDFIFPWQKDIAQRFGLTYYGCCEPIHNRLDVISTIENLHSLSVSPWCDMRALEKGLDRNYVLACKPNPAFVSSGFDEAALSEHTSSALDVFRGRPLEFVMKDVHTLAYDVSRAGRWVSLVRELIAKG